MMFDVDFETRDFATITKKDYDAKKLRKSFVSKPIYPIFEGRHPIIEPYQEHLYTEKKNDRLPRHRQSESKQEVFDRLLREYPHLKKFLPQEPPTEAVIEREQKKFTQSCYQLDYCDSSDVHGSQMKKKSITYKLPENCSIPESMQRRFYRHPRLLDPDQVLANKGLIKQSDHLGVNEKEREILRVRTGNTHYQDVIGKLGKRVLEEQFFGSPPPIDPPEEHIKGPDSARTVCSLVLMGSKNHVLSNVF